ncbi:MAG: branched-chain amino acid ABC transporter permease [Chloroflexi bacterium]|nr:branched-chain amino acid ABC transporter permease [Chloroflexota bacterium]
MRHQNRIILSALFVVIGVLPFVFTSSYHISVMIFIGIHAMLAIGLCLLMGYAGQVSLGHAAFFGLGAYASGILTASYHVDPWLAMGLAAIFTGLVAFIIGKPLFRLKGNNLAMGTLGFGIIVYIMLVEMTDLTGGPSGLRGVPSLSIFGFTFDKDIKYFYLVWALALLFLILSLNIVNSRVGRALRSIHGSEIAAEMLGVDTNKYKIQILIVSAVYASVAGSLYAHYVTFLSPPPFGFKLSIEVLVMVVIGGLSSVYGAIFGAAATTLLSETLRGTVPKLLSGAGGEYEIVVFGVILMVVMIFMPTGLTSGTLNLVRRWRQEKALRVETREAEDGNAVTGVPRVPEGRTAIEDN